MSSMSVQWRILVDSIVRPHKTINFDRKLELESPTEFSATVKYDNSNPIDFFDTVAIQRNYNNAGWTTEWKGFVESIELAWSEDGIVWNIGGRDINVILWKKYGEDFSNMQEGISGFFGRVNVNELIKFLLRTPKSDDVYDYPNNKEGWGIDSSRILAVTADRNDGYGDPEYTILRRKGMGWRNSGDPYSLETVVVGSVICGTGGGACGGKPQWLTHGNSPYLHNDDDNDYIYYGTANAEAQFRFNNMEATDATGIQWVYLTIVWKPDVSWWLWVQSECKVYVSWNGGTTWGYVGNFGGRNKPTGANPWRRFSFDVTNYFNEVSRLKNNNACVKFVSASNYLALFITKAELNITYIKGGTQEKYEGFGLSFGEKRPITGIYVESRADNESYPRNYKIVTYDNTVHGFYTDWEHGPKSCWFRLNDSGYISPVPSDIGKMVKKNGQNFGILLWYDNDYVGDHKKYWWTDNCNSSCLTISDGDRMTIECGVGSATATGWASISNGPFWGSHMYLTGNQFEYLVHKQYQNEDAYFYWDYITITGNPVSDFICKWGFNFSHSDEHTHALNMCVMTNNLENLKKMYDTSGHYYVGVVMKNDGSKRVRIESKDSAGMHYSNWSNPLSASTDYYCKFTRVGTTCKLKIYTDKSLSDDSLFYEGTTTNNTSTFRYRMASVTWMNLEYPATPVFSESFEGSDWASHFTRTGGTGEVERLTDGAPDGTYMIRFILDETEKYYLEKEFTEGELNQAMIDFYTKLPTPDSESINIDLPVNAWHYQTNEFTHVNTEPWLQVGDNDYISGLARSYPTDSYYTFQSLNSKYEAIGGPTVYVKLRGRIGGEGTTSVHVKIYVGYGDPIQWVDAGGCNFTSTNWQVLNGGIDISGSGFNTIQKINGAKLKLYIDQYNGNDNSYLDISEAYLHVEGTGYWGRVVLGKLFDKDVAGTGNPNADIIGAVDARITDNSSNPNKYHIGIWGYYDGGTWTLASTYPLTSGTWYRLRMYVKTDPCNGYVKVYDATGDTEVLAVEKTALNNDEKGIPDCADFEAHSSNGFASTGQKSIYFDRTRIYVLNVTYTHGIIEDTDFNETILANVSNNTYRDIIHSWAPVNIDNLRIEITDNYANNGWSITQVYVYLAEDEDYRVMKEGTANPSFPAEQYIQAITFSDEYAPAVGPLNISRGRLIDQINEVVKICNDNYQPFVWWLAYDNYNTFHMAKRKGSDKSSSITFALGEELGGSSKTGEIDNTAQRVKVMGSGQGKNQDEVSSKWEEDTNGMATVHTFFEDIVTKKNVADKELAKLMAQIYLKENADAKEMITATVTRDPYDSMAYDVGDDVTVSDALISINTSKRIYNISKRINEDGEEVTLYLGTPFKDVEEQWADIFRRLKTLEISGGMVADWVSDSEGKVDITKTTPYFEATALNEEAKAGSDASDPKWNVVLNPAGQGKEWKITEDTIGLYGATSGEGTQTIIVEMKWRRDQTVSEQEAWELVDIKLDRNPKFVCEVKPYESTNPVHSWNTGDVLKIGLSSTYYNETGYWFEFEKLAGGTFAVYACWKETNGDVTRKKLRSMQANKKVRIEITADRDKKWVTFDLYDLSNENNPAVSPSSCVKLGADFNVHVHPIFMKLTCIYAAGKQAQARIYHLRAEWKRIGE